MKCALCRQVLVAEPRYVAGAFAPMDLDCEKRWLKSREFHRARIAFTDFLTRFNAEKENGQ